MNFALSAAQKVIMNIFELPVATQTKTLLLYLVGVRPNTPSVAELCKSLQMDQQKVLLAMSELARSELLTGTPQKYSLNAEKLGKSTPSELLEAIKRTSVSNNAPRIPPLIGFQNAYYRLGDKWLPRPIARRHTDQPILRGILQKIDASQTLPLLEDYFVKGMHQRFAAKYNGDHAKGLRRYAEFSLKTSATLRRLDTTASRERAL